ncbi:MAG: carboxypeptidase regulatory-like domain-containing protein [Bryobacteraceae bacterium]|jgi:hypothetical protein
MKLLVCCLLLALATAAQQAPSSQTPQSGQNQAATPPETKPEDLCAIEGQAVDLATGAPLRKVEITLRGTQPATAGAMPNSYTATSEAGGGFIIKDIEPGKYRLSAQRTGYVTLQYGARGPMRGGTTLTLSTGQRMKDLSLRLNPQGVITGRILDENNDPVASASVRAMRYTYTMGRRQMQASGNANTNDLGEYRLYGLAPGRYYLAARENVHEWESTVDASANPAPDGYVTTYYPGAKDPAAAVQIEVAAGAQLRGLNLTLAKARTFRIRGRVEGRPDAQIMLIPRGQAQWISIDQQNHGTGSKGTFELNGILPGAYTLTASSWSQNKVLTSRQEVDVGDSNIDNLVLVPSPGIEVIGTVAVDAVNPPALDSVNVMLRARDPGRIMYASSSEHLHDGAFTLSDVTPDNYYLQVTGLPDGYWVKSVHMGDQEVRDTGIDLTSGPSGSINVTLAANAGQIDGSVQNDQQQAAPGATVVLVPEPKLRDRPDAYKNITSDQNGRFSFKNLAPGDYRLFAWEDVEYGAYMDPDFLRPFEDRGQSLSIQEGSRESVQLNLISGDAAPSGRKDK